MLIGDNLAAGDLTLAGGQGAGKLFIGTSGRKTAGDINIGTGANESNNLYIGHKGTTVSLQSVKINTSTGASVGTTTIGSSTSGTTIGGALSLTTPITLPTTAVIPTSAQLGYYTTGGVGFTTVSYSAAFPTGTALGSISSIPIGRYLLFTSYAADTFTNIGTYFQLYANMTNGTCDSMMGVSLGQSASTGGKTTGDANGFVTITSTSGTIALRGRTETSGTTVNVYVTMRLIRIA
jgi:hypothetical protein